MYAIEFEAEIENGIIRLPADHPELANGRRVKVVVMSEAVNPFEMEEEQRKNRRARLLAAQKALVELNPFRDIEDPVAWQRQLRDEWEQPLPGNHE